MHAMCTFLQTLQVCTSQKLKHFLYYHCRAPGMHAGERVSEKEGDFLPFLFSHFPCLHLAGHGEAGKYVLNFQNSLSLSPKIDEDCCYNE